MTTLARLLPVSTPLPNSLEKLARMISIARTGAITDALFFDEEAYCVENDDVLRIVEAGGIKSPYYHFIRFGRVEGRRFAVRRWGLDPATADRLCSAAVRTEQRLDSWASALLPGELGHLLRTEEGTSVAKPLAHWRLPPDAGPWRARLPWWARRGGWFMVKLLVAPPARVPFAFRTLDGQGEPVGDGAGHMSKALRATQRLLKIPAGAEFLEIEELAGGHRAAPWRVRLRPVPDFRAEGRMLRRLVHHHQRFMARSMEQALEDLQREAAAQDEDVREVMWRAYQETFPPPLPQTDYQDWLAKVAAPYMAQLDAEAPTRVEQLATKPLISVVVPTFNPQERALRACVESVLAQSYPHWELCIADDASTAQHVRQTLEEYARQDRRIHLTFRRENGHVCRATNDALGLARGQYVALLDHDDVLCRHALLHVAEAIADHPAAKLVYTDEDKVHDGGFREYPHFKPEWDPDLLLGHNYIGHLLVLRTELVRNVGAFRPGFEGSQDHDLLLRVTERLRRDQIVHIPQVLYHWRVGAESTAGSSEAKPYTQKAAMAALEEALERRHVQGRIEPTKVANSYCVYRELPSPAPSVTLIVPTRDALDFLSTCVDSVLDRTDYPSFEVLVVDNGSTDPKTLAYLERVRSQAPVRVLRDERPFNYSALNNRAVEHADGQVVVLLNNDIEVVESGWLRELVAHAVRPEIGCVGAKLLYPDRTIQHAGVLLGLHGLAGHPYKRMSEHHPGYFGRLMSPHTVSAVTAACMAVERRIYQEAGGLDEVDLAVAFNDVDLCLRVREAGYRNLLVPQVTLLHHESASRGYDQDAKRRARAVQEVLVMKQRWGKLLYEDPYYSPHLSLDYDDYSIRIPH